MGRIIEGVWDCSRCNTKDIKASQKECPNCGFPQGQDTKFRLPGKITYLSESEAAKISKNPDWQCSYCGSLNPDQATTCKGCGASKSESEKNYFEMHEAEQISSENNPEPVKETPGTTLKRLDETHEDYQRIFNNTQKPNIFSRIFQRIGNHKAPIIASLCITALLAVIAIMFIPRTEIVQVNGFEWNYSIGIETLTTVNESDWSVPPGGRLQYTQEEIKSYRQVIDHYETVTRTESRQVQDGYEEYVTGYRDLGNGYFEEITATRPKYRTEYYTVTEEKPVYRDEPVMATKYYYEIDKWIQTRAVRTNGTDKNPYWGTVTLSHDEREGSRTKDFKIRCTDDDNNNHVYTIGESDWNALNVNDKIEIKVNNLGQIYEIKFIE